MTQPVTLPLWLLVLVLVFAAVTASTHLLFPSVRWYFRRRAERLVAELNKRLERPIQPFKLLRRQDMIQRVIYDPEVVRAVTEYAENEGVREDVAFEKAHRYAREIVPSFSATAYFGVAVRATRWLSNKLFDVRLHRIDDEALTAVDQNATLVFVINHRSNFDYVLVTYLAGDRSALSYAAGEWAQVWPLSRIVRAMGAYFIRRRSHTELYRKVLASYVKKATEAGVTQAVFPEGGLSRTGLVGPPKLGILSYIVQGWREDGHDVVFVPVSLNYDRVVEDRVLVAAGRSGTRRFRASAPEGIRFTFRYVWRRLRGRETRFGVAGVTFGKPVSLTDLSKDTTDDHVLVDILGARLKTDIEASVPVVTVPLIMTTLLRSGSTASLDEIAKGMAILRADLGDGPPDFGIATDDAKALAAVLDGLVVRNILSQSGDSYTILEPDLAAFYANSIRQFLAADAASAIPPIKAESKSPET
ncbi:1-acyl-sn-glycerol-3-phosphate acyltransferase [Boseongicola aestuarii]|uniref:Glycerol-3-phosphate acyltransferase n=1 Tax=Boseongicola aestuarii TaxID=1470561 RepID=A0A238IWC1_9RHOB|nr:1-acyl-sn-glycerol-3-phosphate acyltransferase [Boseongicola aestuarii]SMX22788.1 Glycerol-3-phosphate acyltransferase [Boseongicola aestuarii]